MPLLILLVFSGISGCQEDQFPILPIDGKITIEMVEEEVLEGEWELAFRLKSQKIYPCFNYPFDFKQKVKRRKIRIEINGVVESGFCLTALGPAKSKILMESLENQTYEFTIEVQNEKVAGELIVSDENYELYLNANSHIEIENEILERE